MQKFFLVLSLLITACLPLLAGDRWENATRDEIWLQDPDMYSPRFKVKKSLPNGFVLLYEEKGLGDISNRRNLTMREYSERHLDLSLVKIKSPEGRMFLGLAEPQKDGNYLPVYGVIDGREAVLYDYDINFKQLPLPKRLTGKWYAPSFRQMFEDADTRWKQTHGGRENKYNALGYMNDNSDYSFLFLPETEEDYLTFGDKPEYQFVKMWSNDFPRMDLGSTTIKKSNGRKKSISQETGGYIIDADVDKWYSMSYDWKPETGSLTLKFGPKIRTKWNVDWHNWEGPKDAYNDNDFKYVNPGAAYMRVEVPKWAQQSPDNVWGELTVKVYAVTDRFMVVSGKSVRAGWNFTEVWGAVNYEGGLLTTNRRKEIVEHLLERCVRARNKAEGKRRAEEAAAAQKSASDALTEENVELMKSKWAPFLGDVLQTYRNECAKIKEKLGRYFSGDFSNTATGIIVSGNTELKTKYDKETYSEGRSVCYGFLKQMDGNGLNLIANCIDFEPYQVKNGEVSFLVGTENGLKLLVFPAEFVTLSGDDGKMQGGWKVSSKPIFKEVPEIIQNIEKIRKPLESLSPKELKSLKKKYPNEVEALEKTPISVKEMHDAMNAYETLSEYLKGQ